MKYSRYILLAIMYIGVILSGRAQNLSIQSKIDRTEIKPGEQAAINFQIRTDNIAETRFYLQQDSTGNSERFVVLAFTPIDTVNITGSLKEIRAQMIITSFDSTLLVIPPIIVQSPSGAAESQPLSLNVVQPKVDISHPDQFNGIKDIWDGFYSAREILGFILIGLILLLLIIGAGIYYLHYLSKKDKPQVIKEPQPQAIQISPIERFLQQVNALPTTILTSQEDYKAFYSRVVELIKEYIEEDYQWSTMELTSSEIEDLFDHKGLSQSIKRAFRAIAQEADLVKFARYIPIEADAIRLKHDAISFAQELRKAIHQEKQRKEVNP